MDCVAISSTLDKHLQEADVVISDRAALLRFHILGEGMLLMSRLVV